jgi:hypothetical protein
MAIDQAVVDILDETIQALTHFDFNGLQALEERISVLVKSDAKCIGDGLHLILAKQRLLELLLQSCKLNLDALNRLHRRNTRGQWAH